MSRYVEYNPEQVWLVPPSVRRRGVSLRAMTEAVERAGGEPPATVMADCGYSSMGGFAQSKRAACGYWLLIEQADSFGVY